MKAKQAPQRRMIRTLVYRGSRIRHDESDSYYVPLALALVDPDSSSLQGWKLATKDLTSTILYAQEEPTLRMIALPN